MIYVFDIDGTICTITNGDYSKAQPFDQRIDIINKLYDEGNTILFQTARGMGRYDNKANLAFSNFYQLTTTQLSKWKVKYHMLFLGKPAGDIYIDDKGVNDENFFNTGN